MPEPRLTYLIRYKEITIRQYSPTDSRTKRYESEVIETLVEGTSEAKAEDKLNDSYTMTFVHGANHYLDILSTIRIKRISDKD